MALKRDFLGIMSNQININSEIDAIISASSISKEENKNLFVLMVTSDENLIILLKKYIKAKYIVNSDNGCEELNYIYAKLKILEKNCVKRYLRGDFSVETLSCKYRQYIAELTEEIDAFERLVLELEPDFFDANPLNDYEKSKKRQLLKRINEFSSNTYQMTKFINDPENYSKKWINYRNMLESYIDKNPGEFINSVDLIEELIYEISTSSMHEDEKKDTINKIVSRVNSDNKIKTKKH